MMMERHYITLAFFEGIFQLDYFIRDKKTNNNRHTRKRKHPHTSKTLTLSCETQDHFAR